MKQIIYILLLIIVGCNNQSKNEDKTLIKDTSQQVTTITKTDNSKYYTTKDTVLIITEIDDTTKYSQKEFNEIIDQHPEFFSSYAVPPYELYSCYGEKGGFQSEVGKDGYYVLYAYFLKQQDGGNKYAEQRKKLIDIYQNINSLFGTMQHGGTYFGHQDFRILGYAEYSVYLYSDMNGHFEKTYDIAKQKQLYIQSLRQLIDDESTIDFEVSGSGKTKQTKELYKTVDDLDKLITDVFYLRQAQEFQYEHYQYY